VNCPLDKDSPGASLVTGSPHETDVTSALTVRWHGLCWRPVLRETISALKLDTSTLQVPGCQVAG
jgi:hypothetical protein